MPKGPLRTTVNLRRMSASIQAGCALGESYDRLRAKLAALEDMRLRYIGPDPVDGIVREAVKAAAERIIRDTGVNPWAEPAND